MGDGGLSSCMLMMLGVIGDIATISIIFNTTFHAEVLALRPIKYQM